MARLNIFLLANGSDTAGGEAGSAGSDELSETVEQFAFGFVDFEIKYSLEEVGCLVEILERVSAFCQRCSYTELQRTLVLLFYRRKKGCVKCVGFLEFADVLLPKYFHFRILV